MHRGGVARISSVHTRHGMGLNARNAGRSVQAVSIRKELCRGRRSGVQMIDTAFILCLVNLGFSLISDIFILYFVTDLFKIHVRNDMRRALKGVMRNEDEEAKKAD